MRNISEKICRENQNILCSIIFFSENRAVYEIMWKNIVQSDRVQMTIWRMRVAFWIPEATDTHSEYVILLLSTATVAARTHLNVTLYVHWLSGEQFVIRISPISLQSFLTVSADVQYPYPWSTC